MYSSEVFTSDSILEDLRTAVHATALSSLPRAPQAAYRLRSDFRHILEDRAEDLGPLASLQEGRRLAALIYPSEIIALPLHNIPRNSMKNKGSALHGLSGGFNPQGEC